MQMVSEAEYHHVKKLLGLSAIERLVMEPPQFYFSGIGYVCSALFGMAAGLVFRSFFSEKGKNLATKQDITAITSKIKSVKSEYATALAQVNASLTAQIGTHSFRYAQEFTILREMSSLLVDVRNATLALRPVLDYVDPNQPEEERARMRLSTQHDAIRSAMLFGEKNRPFYPEAVYSKLQALWKAAHAESVAYSHLKVPTVGFKEYWDKAEENRVKVEECTAEAIDAIRARVLTWDKFSGDA